MSPELKSLEALLEKEAQILRTGEIAKLGSLLSQKEAAWSQAQQSLSRSRSLPDLARIQDIARRNAHLLVAARAGIDAAKKKTEKANAPRAALTTYNAQGQKAALGAKAKSNEVSG